MKEFYQQRLQPVLQRLNELTDALSLFDYLVEEAAVSGLELSRALRQDKNLIKDCDSLMWVEISVSPEGNLCFRGDSDSMLLRGMLALLEKLYRGADIPADASAGHMLLQHPQLKDCFSAKQMHTLKLICEKLETVYGKDE